MTIKKRSAGTHIKKKTIGPKNSPTVAAAKAPLDNFSLSGLLIMLGLCAWITYKISAPFWLAITCGGIAALVMRDPYLYFSKKTKLPNWLAGIILTIFTFVIMGFPITTILWIGIKDGIALYNEINWEETLAFFSFDFLDKIFSIIGFNHEEASLLIRNAMKEAAGIAARFAGTFLKGLPSNLLNLGFAIASFYFLLVDSHKLKSWLGKQFPFEKTRISLTHTFVQTAYGTVAGSIVSALAQGTMVGIAFAICGVPKAVFFGLTAFTTSLIPLIGAAPVWLGAVIYLYFADATTMMIVMIVFGVFITASDNVIRHFMIKGREPMHPLIVLVAIIGGLQWVGPMGIFVGPILAALVLSTIQLAATKASQRHLK